MRDGILGEARALQAAMEAENRQLPAELGIGVTLAGELRCLRTIIHTVIEEMVRRLMSA